MGRGKGWLRATGNRVAEMRGPIGKIRAGSLRYSEDGTFIVAPARDVKTVWVWDAATLERCRAFEGDKVESLPEALRVREPVPEHEKVSRRNAETVVIDESTGKEIAWFALPFYEVTPHPGGRTWAGRSEPAQKSKRKSGSLTIGRPNGEASAPFAISRAPSIPWPRCR